MIIFQTQNTFGKCVSINSLREIRTAFRANGEETEEKRNDEAPRH